MAVFQLYILYWFSKMWKQEKVLYKVDLEYLAQNCIYGWHSIHLMWFFRGAYWCINNQHVCIIQSYLLAEKLPLQPQTRSFRST